MGKQISADGYVFDFGEDVIDAIVWDNKAQNPLKDQMKAVDVIAEFPDEYLFIELKKYDAARGGIAFRCPLWKSKALVNDHCPLVLDPAKKVQASIKRIVSDLRGKYSDTMMCRFAAGKLAKDVNYICVVEGCDAAQTLQLNTLLGQALPKGIPAGSGWPRPIVKNVAVVNVSTWNATPQLLRYGQCSIE